MKTQTINKHDEINLTITELLTGLSTKHNFRSLPSTIRRIDGELTNIGLIGEITPMLSDDDLELLRSKLPEGSKVTNFAPGTYQDNEDSFTDIQVQNVVYND